MSHAPFEAAPDSGLEELSTWPFRSDLRKVLGNRSIWQKVQVVPLVGTSLRTLTALPMIRLINNLSFNLF